MKINANQVLVGFDGTRIMDLDADGREIQATLKGILVRVLVADQKDIDGEEKYGRYKLAERISSSDDLDLTTEETALVKRLVGSLYGPTVVGVTYDLLDGTRTSPRLVEGSNRPI